MNAPTVTKTKNKLEFTPAQATFNKHRRKIDKLRSQIKALKLDLDKSLAQYHSTVLPLNKKLSHVMTNYLLEMIALTKDPKALSKEQRAALDTILGDDVNFLFNLIPHDEVHDEIKKLYVKIHGVSISDIFHEQILGIKEALKEHEGVEDLDFSSLNPNDSLQEMMEKIAKAAAEASHNKEKASPPPPRKKTKKELLKEQKAQQLEALQYKSLNTIYKQLAKEIHPDLEQDPKIRKEKEEVMKRLTTAYKSNDLTTLLMLQCEWINSEEGDEGKVNDETFKIYNSVLKDQIEELQLERDMLPVHPRYLDLFPLLKDTPLDPLEGISTACLDLEDLHEEYTKRLSNIRQPNALKFRKGILKKMIDQAGYMGDLDSFFLKTLMPEMCFD